MKKYCVKCRKSTECKNPTIDKQEVSGLLSGLGIKAPLSKILLLRNILFQRRKRIVQVAKGIPNKKINEVDYIIFDCMLCDNK